MSEPDHVARNRELWTAKNAEYTDPDALRRIMGEIDPLERRDVTVQETRDYEELYPFALIPGLLLLGLELALGLTWLRKVPGA